MKGAYYNEFDPFAAAWLRELIRENLIAPGEVDTRSIEDVCPDDLRGFLQCHFFAGIGVWSLALRNAGWADDRAIWTGSCPCQPFSAAGKGGGFADERHLWPAFHHLIGVCRPPTVAGEQVASKDGLAWLDLVQDDMEAEGYAFGAIDTCAAGFGALFNGPRLYWVASAYICAGQEPHIQPTAGLEASRRNDARGRRGSFWSAAVEMEGADGSRRRVAPGISVVADAGQPVRNRMAILRGAGNALNIAQAQGFIEAVMCGDQSV